ncbi:uncharacterized protein N7515_003269 [Penicillium bovifimosum]|uniref:Dynactin subunit 2 n=1 Tax=Penicillium bovifimosum TaxID=126998 RepID=A0A9W9L5J5_9EURO|nr:uncharacterized protein N7515_003269 [Penicillium bovifimosum]KAJ5138421.1 hypothetical protein N7515_003269 [Penicillium bovifimosum]
MSFNKKYAGLPDLDPSPDIYETPDLTDEASTLPTATIRTDSDHDDAGSNSDIDREGVNADQARMHFMGAAVDARDVNFSDSISQKRQAYRSKSISRHRRRRQDGTEEVGDLSDSEDESLERRLARLRREVEDLKVEMANKPQTPAAADSTEETVGDGVAELSRALDNLHASRSAAGPSHSAAALLSQKLGSETRSTDPKTQSSADASKGVSALPAPNTASSGILTHAAAFDSRLALLESAIGISSTSNPFVVDGINQSTQHPVLPALDQLTSRLSALTGLLVGTTPVSGASVGSTAAGTTPHLETLSTRIRKLTTDAEALTAARRKAFEAAKAVHNARLASSDPDTVHALEASVDNEHVAKVQALYATLPTIQSLHPLLPSVLERLRSLRACHAGAAHAADSLNELEKRHAEMASEIAQWRDGLVTVEEKMQQGEAALRSNLETVEPWVRDLESRLARLEGPPGGL